MEAPTYNTGGPIVDTIDFFKNIVPTRTKGVCVGKD